MFLSPTLTCVVSFLSLCICFLLLICNLLFLFHTKMPWWVLFKVFQKYRLSMFTCHKLSSCKVFQEFLLGGVLIFEGCSDDYLYLFFFLYFRYIYSCTWVLWPLLTYIVLIFFICWCMFLSPTLTCVISFLSLCTCFLLLVCNLLFLFHTKMP